MRIEVLFPEYCGLFGDLFNVKYLQLCLPGAQRLDTSLRDEPKLEPGGLIYLGPMSERTQERVIKKLMPHRDRIKELIGGGTAFLFTGNAMEVLGSCIETGDGKRIEGLGILPVHAKRDMMHRHNSVFLGDFEGQEVTGFKSQFTMAWPEDGAKSEALGLFRVKKGVGLNKKCPYEGLRVNNLFATYLQGPVLPLNPCFAKGVLAAMGAPEAGLAFAGEVQAAYQARVADFYSKVK